MAKKCHDCFYITERERKKEKKKKDSLKSVLLSKAIVVLEYELSTTTDLFRKGGKQTILSCTTLEAPAAE